VAVVSIGEHIESSLLVVIQLRQLGVKTIVAKRSHRSMAASSTSSVSRGSSSRNPNGDPDRA
jgi:hypothetical protein